MNEFSPGTLDSDIRKLLNLVSGKATRSEAIDAIIATYPKVAATPAKQRKTRAGNVLIGLSQCLLVEKHGNTITTTLTKIGSEIAAASSDQQAADLLAVHLIERCFGAELIDAVETIRAKASPVSLENIRDELSLRGFIITENEGNPSKLRQWLEPSGVVDKYWTIDQSKLQKLVGSSSTTISEWHNLPRSQRVFLQVLKELALYHPTQWQMVRQIKKLAEQRFGESVFPTGRLRDQVINPLMAAGWLSAQGKGGGRGGDSGSVLAAPKLNDIKIRLPIDDLSRVPAELRVRLNTPIERIFSDLESGDNHVKGIALELLALNLVRDLGLIPIAFRLRSVRTNGAEVDLLAEGVHLHFSRWLIQCKNEPTSSLEVDYIAKETGMALVLKAHVIVMVTTGKIGAAVRTFADGLARESAFQVVLIDGNILKRYREGYASKMGGAALIDEFHDNAKRVLQLKRPQILSKVV